MRGWPLMMRRKPNPSPAFRLATGWVKNEGGEWVFDPIVAEEGGADDDRTLQHARRS